MKQLKHIPTLKDDGFKTIMAYYDREEYSKKNINDFYIHGLSDNTYELKMPLLAHRQGNHSIIIISNGSIATSSGIDSYTIGKNMMICIPAGQITSLMQMSPDVEGFYLHFASNYLAQASLDLSDWLIRPVIQFNNTEAAHLVALLKRMQQLNESESNAGILKLYLATFLAEMKQSADFTLRINLPAHERITIDFKKLLNEDINRDKSVAYYASELNISANHLNKSVKAALGKAASSFIDEVLILEAKVLMQQSNGAVSEIAFHLGFNDVSYFGRFFKKHTGFAPTEYRKMIGLSG